MALLNPAANVPLKSPPSVIFIFVPSTQECSHIGPKIIVSESSYLLGLLTSTCISPESPGLPVNQYQSSKIPLPSRIPLKSMNKNPGPPPLNEIGARGSGPPVNK